MALASDLLHMIVHRRLEHALELQVALLEGLLQQKVVCRVGEGLMLLLAQLV